MKKFTFGKVTGLYFAFNRPFLSVISKWRTQKIQKRDFYNSFWWSVGRVFRKNKYKKIL